LARNSFTFGPVVVTTVRQASDAPIIDGCTVRAIDGRKFGGVAVRTSRRAQPGTALVVAVRDRATPNPRRWQLAPSFLVR